MSREIVRAREMEGNQKIVIVYDGKCPFCNSYVRLMALRRAVDKVVLIDARSDDPIACKIGAQYDLDEGMAVLYGGKVYYGADAVILISALTCDGSWVARSLAVLLRNPRRAKFFYPIMKFGRRVTLRILGVPSIGYEARGTEFQVEKCQFGVPVLGFLPGAAVRPATDCKRQ